MQVVAGNALVTSPVSSVLLVPQHGSANLVNSKLPSPAPLNCQEVDVLVIGQPSNDTPLRSTNMVGHLQNLSIMRRSGANVSLMRASCECIGGRLAQEGSCAELFGERTITVSASRQLNSVARGLSSQLARGLSHLRCLASVADGEAQKAVIVMEAGCCFQNPAGFSSLWDALLQEVLAAHSRGDSMILLNVAASVNSPPLASAYALSPQCRRYLSRSWEKTLLAAGIDSAESIVQRFRLSGNFSVGIIPMLHSPGQLAPSIELIGSQRVAPSYAAPQRAPAEISGRGNRMKVFIITLPHRGDRRRKPLVCSPPAVAAMRKAGVEVEVLRASCYCDRNAMQNRGELRCCLGDSAGAGGLPHYATMRRYPGAEKPVSADEAERFRSAMDENFVEGADRLVDSMGGTVEGYIVDSNWPGATSCAISHARALMSAALDGYGYALVFEDDAVIPQSVSSSRGWCKGSCSGAICHCPSAWAACVQDARVLAERAASAQIEGRGEGLDVLYLGLGESFEPTGAPEALLPGGGGAVGYGLRWLSRALLGTCQGEGPESSLSQTHGSDSVRGLTQVGYTWQAQAILYTRRALDDLLMFPLSEILWAQDETIPHLYANTPWNHRYVDALVATGWRRRWVAAGPADAIKQGWVYQLETLTSDNESDLGLGTAWKSSNAQEF